MMKNKMDNEIPKLPARPADSHKGTFGRALIIGGSHGMAGAVSLAGMSALRSGAGLVSLAVPESILATVSVIEPSYMTISLSADEHGRINKSASSAINEKMTEINAMAIGPGLGRSNDLEQIVSDLYENSPHPMVFDADALNALAERSKILSSHAGPRIMTPHPGEFARLVGLNTEQVQKNREALSLDFAAQHHLILVLKGAGSIVTDGEQFYVNRTGNPGMATGGSGDVLTGIIVSLVAQGMPPFSAAKLAVHAHGLAGDLAAEELSQQGMIASDLIEFLPYAWKKVQNEQ